MTRRTSPTRIAMAFLGGPIVGGLLVGFWLVARNLDPGDLDTGGFVLAVFAAFGAATVASIAFGAGIVVLGSPVWWLLHRLGQTSAWTATLAGGVVTFCGSGILIACGMGSPDLDWLALILDGAIVGWLIQRIAYRPIRRPTPPPARPS